MFWKNKKQINMKAGRVTLLQETIEGIVKTLIENNINIFIMPGSEECFLTNEDRSVKLCLEDKRIRAVINGQVYSNVFSLKFIEAQKSKVIKELENRREELKKELFRDEINLLKEVTKIYKKEQ